MLLEQFEMERMQSTFENTVEFSCFFSRERTEKRASISNVAGAQGAAASSEPMTSFS